MLNGKILLAAISVEKYRYPAYGEIDELDRQLAHHIAYKQTGYTYVDPRGIP